MILRKTLLDSKETDLFHVLKAIEKKENIMQGVVNKREKKNWNILPIRFLRINSKVKRTEQQSTRCDMLF